MNSIQVLLSHAANFGWCLQQFDMKNAFLHGNLEEVFVEPPPGFDKNIGVIRFIDLKTPCMA